jgi:predicted Zn-dependent peptidase
MGLHLEHPVMLRLGVAARPSQELGDARGLSAAPTQQPATMKPSFRPAVTGYSSKVRIYAGLDRNWIIFGRFASDILTDRSFHR